MKKQLIGLTLGSVVAFGSFAATSDSINIIGSIAKAVSVAFNADNLDLGDMQAAKDAPFTVVANTDYTLSAPLTGTLVNADNGAELGFGISVDKAGSVMTVTPDAISATQAAGNYAANVTLSIAAI
jgi:hypothetical protein